MNRRRPLLRSLLALLFLTPVLLLPSPAPGQENPQRESSRTEQTLAAWLKVALPPTRDLSKLAKLLDKNVLYHDPTAEVYGSRRAGEVRGRQDVLELLGSSKVQGGSFEVRKRFIANEYAVLFGDLELVLPAWARRDDAPLVSISGATAIVLRIRKGKIIEWITYADHVSRIRAMAKHVPSLGGKIDEERQNDLEKTARTYLSAYSRQDLKAMIRCYGETPRFWDPTASLFGMGEALVGKDVIRATLATAFAPVLEMKIEPTRAFFSHRTAVFLSQAEWSTAGSALGLKSKSVSFAVPMMTVLRIEKGKVLEHLDYCDYEPALAKVALLRAEEMRPPTRGRGKDGFSDWR